MPELPEVESYRRKLLPLVRKRLIEDVQVAKPNYAFLSPPKVIAKGLKGARISGLERIGKYLLMRVAGRGTLMVHLGMTGQIFSRDYIPDKHVHMRLTLKGLKHPVFFRDPRKFGKLLWIDEGKDAEEPRLAKLGPDALDIDIERFVAVAKKRRAAIKMVLLDQSVLAGVGNIYADEALHRSGIRPSRAANRVTLAEYRALGTAIRDILMRAIERGGSSINDYVHPDGSLGYFQAEHQVYGREKQPCYQCGSTIKRLVLGQRSSHYCPRCQK